MARISSVRSKIFCDNVTCAVLGLNCSVEGRFSYMLGFPVYHGTFVCSLTFCKSYFCTTWYDTVQLAL